MAGAVSAADWLRRWDAQQTRYIPHREERFTAVVEALAEVVGRPDPVVLDLGCGPGSLSVRIAERLPGARVIALDADPLLLEIGRRALAQRPQISWVDADLRSPDWTQLLPGDQPLDAAVSSTALHWLQADELSDLYATLGRLLRQGGVFIDADRLSEGAGAPRVERAGRAVAAGLRGAAQAEGESWTDWWSAVEADPALAEAVEERRRRGLEHPDDDAAPAWRRTSKPCAPRVSRRSARSGSGAATACSWQCAEGAGDPDRIRTDDLHLDRVAC